MSISSKGVGRCGKKKFTRGKAEAVVESARKSQSGKRQECRVYFCRICQALHTSSRPIEP